MSRYISTGQRKCWNKDNVQRLMHLRDIEHKPFQAIGIELGRTAKSCHAKYCSVQEANLLSRQPEAGTRLNISPEVIADREARYLLRMQQSPIAALMGDPLPGRSALDLKHLVTA